MSDPLTQIIRDLDRHARKIESLEVQDVGPIAARYTTNAGQNLTSGATEIVNFEDQDFDTHAAVTTGASWHFTAPVGGYYQVAARLQLAANSGWAAGEWLYLALYKNGSLYSRLAGSDDSNPGASVSRALNGSDLLHLAAGETLDVRAYQESGGTLGLSTTGSNNHVDIYRVR